MVGVAILGAGDIANVHIEAYKELAGRCRIVALADIYTDKAEAKKQKYGLDCDVVADYKELLGREDVDLVSVCLPPAAHCGVAVDFLKAGKHVLCEKPMAPSLEECDRMIRAAEEGGAKLSVVAQNRFKPDIMKTKQMLESGVLGQLYFAQADSLGGGAIIIMTCGGAGPGKRRAADAPSSMRSITLTCSCGLWGIFRRYPPWLPTRTTITARWRMYP